MKKGVLTFLLAIIMIFAMVGCGRKEEANTQTAVKTTEKQKIVIAIGNDFKPFCYLSDKEEPAGYEYELLKLVAEKMSDKYEVQIISDNLDNLLSGLETGKYNVVSNHFVHNSQYAEKYNVSSESLMYYGNYRVLHKEDRTDITDLESLKGMVLANSSGTDDNFAGILNDFNEENSDNPIILQKTIPDTNIIFAGIKNDSYDGYISTEFDLKYYYIDPYPEGNLVIGEVDLADDVDCGIYALIQKGNDALQADFDAAVKAVRNEGKIKDISIKWFGKDYSIYP